VRESSPSGLQNGASKQPQPAMLCVWFLSDALHTADPFRT
jgi:hypothetical protein